uniref:Uncharacterized protein n=1 Tax=Romanomermis culicivorax TaxID=13658 RepID=A0A915LA35_ROMCU
MCPKGWKEADYPVTELTVIEAKIGSQFFDEVLILPSAVPAFSCSASNGVDPAEDWPDRGEFRPSLVVLGGR